MNQLNFQNRIPHLFQEPVDLDVHPVLGVGVDRVLVEEDVTVLKGHVAYTDTSVK